MVMVSVYIVMFSLDMYHVFVEGGITRKFVFVDIVDFS